MAHVISHVQLPQAQVAGTVNKIGNYRGLTMAHMKLLLYDLETKNL